MLEKASDPLASASDLAVLIHRDQGLALEILHDANSAGQAGRIAIVSLRQSTARLGVQRVIEIAISASIRDSVFNAKGFELELRQLWRRCVATALFSKEIARLTGDDPDSAFLAGLFRRVGTALLIRSVADLRKPGDPKFSFEEFCELDVAFRVRLGLDAAIQWGLSKQVQDAISSSGDESKHGRGERIIALAEKFVELLVGEHEAKEEALAEDPILDELGLSPEEFEGLLKLREAILRSIDRGE